MTWHAWSDGSCVHAGASGKGYGGWAAVIEHGSDGWVMRGRHEHVTSSRMELVGVLEALASIPAPADVVLHVDCTLLLSVRDAWERSRGGHPVVWSRRRDPDLWVAIAERMDVMKVTIEIVGKGGHDSIHQRCHRIANAEARALFRGMPPPSLERRRLRAAPHLRPGLRHAATGWQAFDNI